MLGIRDLGISYLTTAGPLAAVQGVNLDLAEGETLGIVGESGCGKSTLANSIMRTLPRNASISGEIAYDGTDLLRLSKQRMVKIRWEKIAMVFQNAQNSLDPTLRVGAQIVGTIMAHKAMSLQSAKERVKELFGLVGLPYDYHRSFPHELSGGSRQRVIIAMSLALNPNVLIADEPTTGLDVSIQLQVLELLKELKRKFRMSMIFITHDVTVAKYVSDRVAVMYAGQVVEIADVSSLFREPLHPYTMALVDSLLTLSATGVKQPIPGYPPNLIHPPQGCRFAERCKYATDLCRKEDPPVFSLGGRLSRCHYAYDFSK